MNGAVLLSMAGGLGLFLFGMQLMSESIERAAGDKLRKILEFFTTNRFTGMLVGVLFTAIIQSSSACTVMVVTFVNSGLMNLSQAAGVIFGANIGTTVTSQLVSFNLSKFAPVFLLGGVIAVMFVKNDTVKKIGSIVLGFGVLFMGLSGMSSAMGGLKEDPTIVGLFESLTSPLLAVLLGTVVTAVIQSSSVTVSIILLMANQGLLPLRICLFIVLGCNIGACASAMLASLAGKKSAKRAAMIHLLFNVIGTVIFYFIFLVAADPIIAWVQSFSPDNGRFVANAHTLIKVFQVIMLFPFAGIIVKLTYLFVPGEDQKVGYHDNFQLKYIGDKVMFNPATAVVDVIRELERMASLASDNLNRAMNALITLDIDDIKEVAINEENINFLNKQITNYLVKISQATLPIEDIKNIGALFHVVNDIERIGDHADNIAECAERRISSGTKFSLDAQKELAEMMELVNTIIKYSVDMFANGNLTHMQEVVKLEEQIDELERKLQQMHVDRLTKNECTPEAGMLFSDVISGLERVADHATNIAFAVVNNEKADEA